MRHLLVIMISLFLFTAVCAVGSQGLHDLKEHRTNMERTVRHILEVID